MPIKVSGMWRRGAVLTTITVVLALGCVGVDVACTPGAAFAGPGALAQIVIADTLPGLVASPTGPTNGPIDNSNLQFFTGANARADLARLLAQGDVHGYLRVWAPQPPNGDGVGIVAWQFDRIGQVGAFLAGLTAGERQAGGVAFPVPDLPGASGYTVRISTSGARAQQYTVAFAKGSTAFEVEVIDATGTLTMADVATVALEQAANAPGAPRLPSTTAATGTSWVHRTGVVVGLAVLGLLVVASVVLVVRRMRNVRRTRRRRRTRGTHRTPRTRARHTGRGPAPIPVDVSGYGALTSEPSREVDAQPPPAIGWHGDPDHISEQAYWDGERWTGRRRWNGAVWVEGGLPPIED